MARQAGILKFTGSMDDLSFYESDGEFFVRRKGGPTRRQVKTGVTFERSRENASEFGCCSKAGSLLRRAIRPYLGAADTRMYRRLTQLMTDIKQHDRVSRRGERSIGRALETSEGRALLASFEFNRYAGLRHYVPERSRIDKRGRIHLSGERQGIIFPEGATQVIVRAARLNIDFDRCEAKTITYNEINLIKDRDAGATVLEAGEDTGQAANPGMLQVYVLQLCFFTESGNGMVPLLAGKLDALGILSVLPGTEESTPQLYVNADGLLISFKQEEGFRSYPIVFAPTRPYFNEVPLPAPA